MNILQSIIFPNFDIEAPEDLYVRNFNGATVVRNEGKILFLQKGASCVFDTFFNSFTIQTWKNKTAVRKIKLQLFGEGDFLLKINRNKLHSPSKHISEQHISLSGNGVILDFADLDEHTEGMLFFELVSLSDNSYVNGGHYLTEQEPVNPVKLGIVITHFNRKHYVLPAIDRVSTQLLHDPYYEGKIDLIVVDNSQNITPEEAQSAIVLPNQNLGGSGGFTRGLMYLEEQKNYTHCLFMDDDASCEVESIRRAFALLQYSVTEKFAISGAQLREEAAYQLHEKGGYFGKHSIPLHHGLDMRNVHDLLVSESCSLTPNYGAWWFFAFRIQDVIAHPFPFFVRGDDILFSLSNGFSISTLNGINVWGEDFWFKESPLTRYLGLRSCIVCDFFQHEKSTKWNLIKTFKSWYFNCLAAYNYSSAEAVITAVTDVLTNNHLFDEDISAAKARARIAALPQDEKMQPIKREDYDDLRYVGFPSKWKHRVRKWVRRLTLNYLLLPDFLLKDATVFQQKHYSANLDQIYRFKRVYYEHEAAHTGYVAKHDKKRLLKGYLDYIKTVWLIYERFDAAKAEYRAKQHELTSREFWEKVYAQDDKSE